MKLSVLGLLLALSLVTGCSGIKTYPNDLDKNLHLRTTAESGSFFSSIRTAVHIHRVAADCTTEYEGTVELDQRSIDIGIPPERWSRLVFVFASSSFLLNSTSSISYETLLNPRAGYEYDLRVTYRDDIYNVSVLETHRGDSPSRKIEHRPLSACQASEASQGARRSPSHEGADPQFVTRVPKVAKSWPVR